MKRKFESWIDAYIQYTAAMGSPTIFSRWAAIAAVAGALERKVWVKTAKGILYPNLYTILVGEPGVGKTLQTDLVWELWESLAGEGHDTHRTAAQSINHATIIDELRDAERKIIRMSDTPPMITFHSLLVAVNELSVLLPAYDIPMMAKLTDLYDCKVYGERRRGKELNFRLEATQINLLSATTPGALNTLLPDGAWEQGFLSRVLLIYSGQVVTQDLWTADDANNSDPKWKELEHDLQIIGELFGAVKFTREAAEGINEWQKQNGPPRPVHPKLANYCARRTAHLLKLCTVICASYSDGLVVTMDHYLEALGHLLEAEKHMTQIFKAMTSGGDRQVMDDTWHFAYEMYARDQKPIREALIYQFMSSHVDTYRVQGILEMMLKVGIFTKEDVNKIGVCYIPKARKIF